MNDEVFATGFARGCVSFRAFRWSKFYRWAVVGYILHHFETRYTGFREPVVAEYAAVIETMPRVGNARMPLGRLSPWLGTCCRDTECRLVYGALNRSNFDDREVRHQEATLQNGEKTPMPG